MKLFDKFYYKPFLWVFYLSGIERIINGFVVLCMGSLIGSTSIDLTNKIQSMKDLSSWYVTPFVLISYWLLDPLLSLTSKTELKDRRFSHFVVDILWMIIVLSCLELVYRQMLSIFVDHLWSNN